MTVPMKPPMKPSQVFLGDSLISGVRPKKKPAGEGSGWLVASWEGLLQGPGDAGKRPSVAEDGKCSCAGMLWWWCRLVVVAGRRLQRTCQVGHDVVDHDQECRQDEPDDALEDVGHEEGGGDDDDEDDHVRPGVLAELVHVHLALERQHKGDKACRQAGRWPAASVGASAAASLAWGTCCRCRGQEHQLQPSG
jgi:hypothetical protein